MKHSYANRAAMVALLGLLSLGGVEAQVVVHGSVFGAGKGLKATEADKTKALVHGDATVDMRAGAVLGSVYGGGEMATVGEYHYATAAEATAYNSTNTGYSMTEGDVYSHTAGGTTHVLVSGGTVGTTGLDPTDINAGGNVFGGGLGDVGGFYTRFAYVDTARVSISGSALVRGSVFGGGENGHVKGDTYVDVSGGTVGERIKYRYRAISSDEGVSNPVYAGNVYGGGRGVDHTAVGDHLSQTAGRVYGNTHVSVSGTAHIRHSVYGGGSLASVGTYALVEAPKIYGGHLHNFIGETGDATVTISGGRIGPSWDDLAHNEAGDYLLDANGDPLNSAARDTIAKNYDHLGENEGMVYGSGRGVNYPNDDNTDHRLYVEMAFTRNTTVTVSDTADIVGSVFGGGENGHVKLNTKVNIEGGTIGGMALHRKDFYLPGHSASHGLIEGQTDSYDELAFNNTGIGKSVFRGNVYGGGRGIDHTSGDASTASAHIFSVSAGRVYGNSVVNVSGGHILHNVFGGGSIASVGTYNYPSDGGSGYDFFANPTDAVAGTGTTTVTVTGGRIGVMGENEGYVFGGGRGIAGTNETQVSHLAFVNDATVVIGSGSGTHADVRASVFGGGMNGHVLTHTRVTMTGGVVGGKTADEYGTYDLVNFPLENKPARVDTTIDGIGYYSGNIAGDTLTNHEGLGPATVFLGNVYGGGRGVDTISGAKLSFTAGRVYGNTTTEISGGVVYHSVFGGGSIASVGLYELYTQADVDEDQADIVGQYRIQVNQPKSCLSGGKSTVTISGGRIGTNGRNNGRVFGSSRGMAGTSYRGLGYVNIAHVNIKGSAEVRGSVFGSGENGHVRDSTLVSVSGGHVGHGKRTGDDAWMNNYIGNVYGGGRGLDRSNQGDPSTVSPFAGRVARTANVVVTGGQIDQNVYGGGSLASVGRYKRDMNPSSATYNQLTYTDPDKGTCRVTVSGGTIGIDGDNNGHVFGSSRGTATHSSDIRSSLAYVARTEVNITDSAEVRGSVFGGGESGHVQGSTIVNVSGGEIGLAIGKDYASCTDAEKEKYDLMGNVYGGGRGVDSYVVVDDNGDTIKSTVDPSADSVEYSMSAGYVRGNTTVTISGNPTIHRNVYGGGSMGIVGLYGPYGQSDYYLGSGTNGLATVTINATVGTAADAAHGYGGNVFGSSRGKANDPGNPYHDFADMAYVYKTLVTVDSADGNSPTVYGSVYGGGESGHVDWGGTTVNIVNGTVKGNVFGGGRGSSLSPTAGIVDGPTQVNIGTEAQLTGDIENTVVVEGHVFGGNDAGSSPLGTMTVDIWRTAHSGNNVYPTLTAETDTAALLNQPDSAYYAISGVYGGGNEASVLTGDVSVDAPAWAGKEALLNQKYITQRLNQTDGGIPANHTPWPGGTSRLSKVTIHNCEENTVMYVYGGGRAADTWENEVLIEGGRVYRAFAGGDGHLDGTKSDVVTDASITVEGGLVYQVFGGSNTNGIVLGTASVNLDPQDDCELVNHSIFGGGNEAPGGSTMVTIPCHAKGLHDIYGGANEALITGDVILNILGGQIERAFGGSRNAEIDGNVTVNVYGGAIDTLFGGNNVAGNITGQITVNVDWGNNNCSDTLVLGTVFGGGNEARYLPTPVAGQTRISPSVNIVKARVDHNVFGGGNGSKRCDTCDAEIKANPSVLIGAPRYAGRDSLTLATPVDCDTVTIMGSVFGGGNASPTDSSTTVVVRGEHTAVYTNVYGAGNAAIVGGNTDLHIGYYAGSTATPTLTPSAGEGGKVRLTAACTTPGAVIYYTVDGTDPAAGEVYNGPVEVEAGTTVKIRAYRGGYEPSTLVSTTAALP